MRYLFSVSWVGLSVRYRCLEGLTGLGSDKERSHDWIRLACLLLCCGVGLVLCLCLMIFCFVIYYGTFFLVLFLVVIFWLRSSVDILGCFLLWVYRYSWVGEVVKLLFSLFLLCVFYLFVAFSVYFLFGWTDENNILGDCVRRGLVKWERWI